MQILCDCRQTLVPPEDFFEGSASDFFYDHGHFPDLITLVCAAGHIHETGPEIEPDPEVAADLALAWYTQHRHCQEMDNGARQ